MYLFIFLLFNCKFLFIVRVFIIWKESRENEISEIIEEDVWSVLFIWVFGVNFVLCLVVFINVLIVCWVWVVLVKIIFVNLLISFEWIWKKKKICVEVYLNELFIGWGKDFLFVSCVFKICFILILVNE